MVHGGSPHQAPAALTALAEAVEGLAVAPVTDELVELMSVSDRFEAKVVEALSAFFASGGHAVDGYRSPISWLRAHVPVSGRDASLLVTWAKRVPDWPVLAKLWFDGELNRAQYAAVCARLQAPSLVELYADHDADVSPLLVGLSVTDTTTAIDQWARMAESVLSADPAEVEVPEPGDPMPVDGELKVSRYGDGIERGMITGDLDPDATTIVQKALNAAMPPLVEGDTRTHPQRQAEAWVRICERFLDHAACDGSRGTPAARMIVVAELADLYRTALWGLGIDTADDLERLLAVVPVSIVEEGWLRHALAHSTGKMRTIEGWPLSPPEVTRLFGKNSTIERVMLADGQVLDHGRRVRLYTGGIRDVILVRDRGCRFPSPTGEPCGAPVPWLHAHHIDPWEDGGDTSTANGVALCPTHHALVHTPGWTLTVDPDGTIHVTTPDGTVLTGPPPGASRPPQLPLHHPKIDALRRRLPDEPVGPANEPEVAGHPDRRLRSDPAAPAEHAARTGTSAPADAPDAEDGSGPPGLAGAPGPLNGRERPETADAPRPAPGPERPEAVDRSEHADDTDDVDGPGHTIACSTAETITIRLDRPADLPPTEGRDPTESAGPDDAAAEPIGRPEAIRDLLRRSATHRSGRRRYPDLVVTMPDGEELWLRLTTAA